MSKTIFVGEISTPLGEMIVASSDKGISLLLFSDNKDAVVRVNKIASALKCSISMSTNKHILHLRRQLSEYFASDRTDFDIPLHLIGTDFQLKVWQSLSRIPFGSTISYGQQASLLGVPSSVRAVANGNGRNPVVILLPCHRVIGSDGTLKGFSSSIWRKQYLLQMEQKSLLDPSFHAVKQP